MNFWQLKHPLPSSSQFAGLWRKEIQSVFKFHTVLPLPGLCSARNSEPSLFQPYTASLHFSWVGSPLAASSFSHVFSRQKGLTFHRKKTFHTFWVIHAAFFQTFSSPLKLLSWKNIFCRNTYLNNLFLNVSRFLTDHGPPS